MNDRSVGRERLCIQSAREGALIMNEFPHKKIEILRKATDLSMLRRLNSVEQEFIVGRSARFSTAAHFQAMSDFRRSGGGAGCRRIRACGLHEEAQNDQQCREDNIHENKSRRANSPNTPPVWIKTGTAPGRRPPRRIVAIAPVIALEVYVGSSKMPSRLASIFIVATASGYGIAYPSPINPSINSIGDCDSSRLS